MANYRPKANSLAATVVASGTAVLKNISTSTWGMALLQGTALSPTGAIMTSGAVDVWQSTALTTGVPSHTTFTDAEGQYGVTVKANVALVIKFYGK